MDPHLIVPVGVLIALALVLQGAVGFGFGMFSIPLMVWMGLSLPQAIGLSIGVQVCQISWGVYHYRDYVGWRATWPLVPAQIVGLPVGVFALWVLVGLGPGHIKQTVGAVLLIVLLLQWLGRVKPRQTVAPRWSVAAGLASGFLSGLTGMGGPPIVLWVMAHDWPSKRLRVMIWASFIQAIPIEIALLSWTFGAAVPIAVAIGLGFFPVALLASSLGMKLGSMMPRHRLRVVAFVVLMIIGMVSILGPLWQTL